MTRMNSTDVIRSALPAVGVAVSHYSPGLVRPDAHGATRLGCIPPGWRPAFLVAHRLLAAATLATGAANCVTGTMIFEKFYKDDALKTLAAGLIAACGAAWVSGEAAGLPARGGRGGGGGKKDEGANVEMI